jgi:hypothetical protein
LKDASKNNPKYFRGDELPAAMVKASLTPVALPAPVPTEASIH